MATIKENDVVSKMVCHRCCEIALKLHRYRNNAVANDKLLKERCGQLYTPPITDQEELLRITTKLVNQRNSAYDESVTIVDDSDSLSNSSDLLNEFVKKEDGCQPLNNASSAHLSYNRTCKSCADVSFDLTQNRLSSDHLLDNFAPAANTTINPPQRTAVLENANVNDRFVTPNASNSKEHEVSSSRCKNISYMKYKHPSVRKLFQTYEGIILPEKVFRSDVSPVITLDRAEVDDWYIIKQRLPSVIFKKIPNSSNYRITSSPSASCTHIAVDCSKGNVTTSPKQNRVTSSKRGAVTSSNSGITSTLSEHTVETFSSKNRKLNVNNRRMIDASDSDNNVSDRDGLFNFDHQKENDAPETNIVTTNARLTNQQEITVSKNNGDSHLMSNQVTTLTKKVNSHNQKKKNKTEVRSRRNRKRTYAKDADVNEIIPVKKKRIYYNKNALSTFNKVDLPQECPPDKIAQKAIFTSSLELTPVESLLPLGRTPIELLPSSKLTPTESSLSLPLTPCELLQSSKQTPIEPLPFLEATPDESQLSLTETHIELLPSSKLTCVEPPPELITHETQEIFLCPLCNKLHDTKEELIEHEKTHLKCKFCNKILENIEVLSKHQNESCFTNIVNNQPFIELERVDAVPSIIKTYTQAFQNIDVNKYTRCSTNLNCKDHTDCKDFDSRIEEVVLPMPANVAFIGSEEIDQSFGLTEQSSLKAVNESSNIKSEVICISDNSDDEIECIEIPRHKIVENPYFRSATETAGKSSEQSQNTVVDLALRETAGNQFLTELDIQTHIPECSSEISSRSKLGEKEMIRYLFKKHAYAPLKCENGSQTFTLSDSCIAYTKSNLIQLKHMYNELFFYKIPVCLESQLNITAKFKESFSSAEQRFSDTLECWAHKKYVTIQKPKIPLCMPLKNVSTVLNCSLNKTDITSDGSRSVIVKNSAASNDSISNIITTTGKPKHYSTDAVISTVSSLHDRHHSVSSNFFNNANQQLHIINVESPNTTIVARQGPGVTQNTVWKSHPDPYKIAAISNECTSINTAAPAANSTFGTGSSVSLIASSTSTNNLCSATSTSVSVASADVMCSFSHTWKGHPDLSTVEAVSSGCTSVINNPAPKSTFGTSSSVYLTVPSTLTNNLNSTTSTSVTVASADGLGTFTNRNLQQLSDPAQSTIMTAYQAAVASQGNTLEDENSTQCTKDTRTATNTVCSTTNVVPFSMSLPSTNNLYGAAKPPVMLTHGGSRYQQEFISVAQSNSSNSALVPRQSALVSRNNTLATLVDHQNQHKTLTASSIANPAIASTAFSTAGTVPFTMPVNLANNLPPTMMAYSNVHQQQPTSFLQIIEQQNSATTAFEAAYPTTNNKTVLALKAKQNLRKASVMSNVNGSSSNSTFNTIRVAPCTVTLAATNNPSITPTPAVMKYCNPAQEWSAGYMQIVEPSNSATTPYQPTSVAQSNSSLALKSQQNRVNYYNQSQVFHINNNVTNVNKMIILSNNAQQLPPHMDNSRYKTSSLDALLNNPVPCDQANQTHELETVKQQLNGVRSEASVQLAPKCSGILRVKDIKELTE